MSTLFVILFLLSLGLLLWGLASPSSISKFGKKPLTRRDAGVGFGLITLVMFIMVGVTAPEQQADKKSTSTSSDKSSLQSEAQTVKPKPVITKQTVTETETIPFTKLTVNDATRSKGTSTVTTVGVNGVKTFTYEITKTDGVQTDKKLLKEEVATQPVAEVTSLGTKVAAKIAPKPAPKPASSNCDPNYSGACVPIASDVDCGGGSGNGPAYVYGTVKVIGTDIYDLDRDGNGYGCE